MPVSAKGVRFIPASSQAGRKFVAAKGTGGALKENKYNPIKHNDPAIEAHNAEIDRLRREKKEGKK